MPVVNSSTPEGQNGLVFILELDKTSYRGNESIWATLTIKNADLRFAVVNKRMFPNASYALLGGQGDVAFVISDPDNAALELGFIGAHPTPFSNHDFVSLTVGQGIQYSEYRLDLLFEGRFNKSGIYQIQAFYANQLVSNVLEFIYSP
jgi:hypothetical protein